MAALFLLSAILQYNDPDPLIWIVIYLIATVISVLFALKRMNYLLPLFVGILALVGTYLILPAKFEGFEIGTGNIKNIEEAREAGGLFIIGLIMIIYSIRLRLYGRS